MKQVFWVLLLKYYEHLGFIIKVPREYGLSTLPLIHNNLWSNNIADTFIRFYYQLIPYYENIFDWAKRTLKELKGLFRVML